MRTHSFLLCLVLLPALSGHGCGKPAPKPSPVPSNQIIQGTAMTGMTTVVVGPVGSYLVPSTTGWHWVMGEQRFPRLMPPIDPPPSRIRVGPYVYRVHYTSARALESQGALALTRLSFREIWLNPRRGPDLRVDVLHELMHCAKDLGTSGERVRDSGDDEEDVIATTSPSLVQILQDNPRLTAWLAR